MMTPKQRLWLYGIVTVALPILAIYGIVRQEDVDQWLLLASAILGVGGAITASANVPGVGRHRKEG